MKIEIIVACFGFLQAEELVSNEWHQNYQTSESAIAARRERGEFEITRRARHAAQNGAGGGKLD